jgi:toxin YoeB
VKVTLTEEALNDLGYWIATGNTRNLKKIHRLITDIVRDPHDPGIGKTERLKNDLAGYSSRRITQEDRLVYKVTNGELIILQMRGHY